MADLEDFRAFDQAGDMLGEGDSVRDFRTMLHEFIAVAAAPVEGKSGKITTSVGTFYTTVFPGLSILDISLGCDYGHSGSRVNACDRDVEKVVGGFGYCLAHARWLQTDHDNWEPDLDNEDKA